MSLATLAGHRATRALATLPEWGCWYADASIDGEHELSGAVELVIADLKLKGTVLSGGPMHGRSTFRLVGGSGGWGKTIDKWSYNDDAGVKTAKILEDAARKAGEKIDLSGVPNTERVGPTFTRPAGPASSVLAQLKPSGWYIGEDGVTRIGKRPKTTLAVPATRETPVDKSKAAITLAAESIATIVPGVTVDGLVAVDVEHEISAEGGLRSKVWGARAETGTSRGLATLRRVIELLFPNLRFSGCWEYRVVTLSGKRVNVQPVRVSSGMPDLPRVPIWPGVAGCDATLKLGSRVLVVFMDNDPSRPAVVASEDPDGEGFVPTLLTIAKGVVGAARLGDAVVAGPFGGTVTSGSTKVRIG